MDSEKQIKILDAALEVFLRYGFKKATMGDIATKAEMSRPSVYLEFSNKEDVFRAVIVRKMEMFFAEAQEKIAHSSGMEAKIAGVLDAWVLGPYRLIKTCSDPEDLLEFCFSFAYDLQRKMLKMVAGQLVEVISDDPETDPAALAKAGLDIETVARLIAVSTVDIKHSVTDVEELEQLVNATVKIYVTFLTGRCGSTT